MLNPLVGVLAGALGAAAVLAPALPAAADSFPSEAAVSRVINVPKNKSLSFQLDAPASRIVVAQPETAQIVATTDHSFYVRGKALGATNLLVYGAGGRLTEVIDVRVGYDAGALQSDLAAALPGERIGVHNLGEGLLLTGDVSTTGVATRAKAFADKFAPDAVTSALTVRASQQVILEVRIIEAGRSALQDIGFSIAASGPRFDLAAGAGLIGAAPPQGLLHLRGTAGSANIDVTLQALEEKGSIRTLARPNLTALSGEKSSFLAGGEFPFPIPAGKDMVAIEFRPFGVTLNFTPTVQDNGLIRLAVAPEVSQLDPRNSLHISGFDVPSLTVRRAATTVELRGGESFAIAGLLQQDYLNTVRQIPGVGDLPVLGALFRSSRWNKQETELVIIVTPRLAAAADFTPQPATPLSAGQEPGAIELFLTGKALDVPLRRQVTAGWTPEGPRS
ncbi:type II and III secretion system protein family protein [Phenylobacterium sp.]|jgi:pilus assembly protein CpaC|uniref:type II and III secretion system protein family protein n=1 Tax=Phenylobacterium sp. TaxID=1871053 RepID=UPI002F416C5B